MRIRSLDIHGYVEGGIDAEELCIHPGGRVFGTVRADHLEVNGHLQGDVRVKNLIAIGSMSAMASPTTERATTNATLPTA